MAALSRNSVAGARPPGSAGGHTGGRDGEPDHGRDDDREDDRPGGHDGDREDDRPGGHGGEHHRPGGHNGDRDVGHDGDRPVGHDRSRPLRLADRRADERGDERVWRTLRGVVSRLALVATITLVVVAIYDAIIEPWHQHWGATGAEIARAYPGDVPGARYVTTRAVTIGAPPEKVWPWLVQMGQGRGGFYSYEILQNLVGREMHNAERIHPEWQTLRPGDVVRPVPEGYLGMRTSPAYRVMAIEPERLLILEGFGTFVLEGGVGRTRLVVRSSSPSALAAFEPCNFIMSRRMLLGIAGRAEGLARSSTLDTYEVGLWAVALVASIVAGVRVLRQSRWLPPTLSLIAAIMTLLALVFMMPPLLLGTLFDAALVTVLVLTHGASTVPAEE